MEAARTCPECGAVLTPGALEGLCPKCIGQVTFGLDANGDPVPSPTDPQSALRELRALGPFSSCPFPPCQRHAKGG